MYLIWFHLLCNSYINNLLVFIGVGYVSSMVRNRDSCPVLTFYYVLGIMLSIFVVYSHLILQKFYEVNAIFIPLLFTNEETEAQRNWSNMSKVTWLLWDKTRIQVRKSDSKPEFPPIIIYDLLYGDNVFLIHIWYVQLNLLPSVRIMFHNIYQKLKEFWQPVSVI